MARQFEIIHTTRYTYSSPVTLAPHIVRLSPRPDYFLRMIYEETIVEPTPVGASRMLDENDNRVTQYWFKGQTEMLQIKSRLVVRMNEFNPFGILVNPPDALRLPMRYRQATLPALAPALTLEDENDAVRSYSEDLAVRAESDTLVFLELVTHTLHHEFLFEWRYTGPPRTAAETLELGSGSCRDLALLFMEICRYQGIAARFVSGYTPLANVVGDPELHAWCEAFVPGGGWIGFDPAQGRPLQGQHVPLAAAPRPADAAPVTGLFTGYPGSPPVATIEFSERLVF